MEWLTNLFFGSFIFGLIFTVLSFVLGGLSGHGGFDAPHGHVSGGHAGHLHTDTDGFNFLSLFNFSALVVAITWFGGVGLVVQSLGAAWGLSIVAAMLAAFVGYVTIFLILVKILYPMQTPPLDEKDYDLYGTVGRVSSSLHENGIGEIIYNKAGTRRAIGARSLDGLPIPRDTKVVILKHEKGVAYVRAIEDVLSEHGKDFSQLDTEAAPRSLP